MLATMLYPSTVMQASISTSMPKLFMITQLEFSLQYHHHDACIVQVYTPYEHNTSNNYII